MKPTPIAVCLFFLSSLSFGQSNKGVFQNAACGTPPMPDSIASRQKWFGNNNYLLEVLKNNGYDLPADYFDEIDTRGFYKGAQLNIADYKRDAKNNSDSGKPDKSGRSEIGGNNPKTNLVINGQTVKYIRLKAYSHLNSTGQGYTASQINSAIDATNELYRLNNVPIIFYSLCNDITFIPNSTYYDISSELNGLSMFINYGFSNSTSVHFINSYIINGKVSGGVTYAIGSPMLLVTKFSGTTTLAHELGHSLGLQHTHLAKLPCVAEGNEDCADCWQEPVSRTLTNPVWCLANVGLKKCAVNADGLCDTPGEPNLSGHVTSGCVVDWNSGVDNTDNWSAQWTPMAFNIMSYAREACRGLFSPGQIAIMLATVPSFATTADPYLISGATIVCNNYNYSYSIPSLAGVSNYTWAVPAGASIVSGQGTTGITVYFASAGVNQTVRVTPNCGFPRSQINVSAIGALTISGPASPSINQSVSYSATNLPGAYYSWTMPVGWGYSNGQGTRIIGLTAQSYAGAADLYVSTTAGSCTLYGSKSINVQDGGIQMLMANTDNANVDSLDHRNDIKNISIYEFSTGKFISVTGSYKEAWAQMSQGLNIIRIRYEGYSETIKVVKQ